MCLCYHDYRVVHNKKCGILIFYLDTIIILATRCDYEENNATFVENTATRPFSACNLLSICPHSCGMIMMGKLLMLEKLSTLEDVQELYKWFEHMRTQQPTWFDESSSCWHVFRYDDVYRVITDSTLFSSERLQNRAIN